MRCVRQLACAPALAAALLSLMTAGPLLAETLSGSATYRERIAPPPDAHFVATLEDLSRADAPSKELGRVEIANAGAPPYAFEIEYDTSAITPSGRYAVRATLSSAGRLIFTTDTIVPVLSGGASATGVSLVMRMVDLDGSEPGTEGPQMGAHGLRLPASFTGTLPCADCEGIAHHLDLWPDQTYHLSRSWLGRGADGGNTRDEIGRWSSDPERSAILLHGVSGGIALWQVTGPDRLRLLDSVGNPILSDLNYDLLSDGTLREAELRDAVVGNMQASTAEAALLNTYWRIERLQGEVPVPVPDRREPHLLLRGGAEAGFSATMGCNRMIGGFKLDGDTLTFSPVASTLMACPAPLDAQERALGQTLAAVRGYRISGHTMELLDEAGTPIALLRAVYLP